MLSNNFPIDEDACLSLELKGEPLEMIRDRVAFLSDKQLTDYADQLRPFLFDEQEVALILNARSIIPSLLDSYTRQQSRVGGLTEF